MKLLIVGSRSISEFDIENYVPSDVSLIITGGANGVDLIAEKYADKHRISKLVLRPDYKRFGRGAPLKRNEEMVDISDRVLVIWDGMSKGTLYTIEYAEKKNKLIAVVTKNKTQK